MKIKSNLEALLTVFLPIVFFVSLFVNSASANPEAASEITKKQSFFQQYSYYFSLAEPESKRSCFENAWELIESAAERVVQELSLISWNKIDQQFSAPEEKYDRLKKYGTWIHDPSDQTCLDTRGKVLDRDSLASITIKDQGCRVLAGHWKDPYTGQDFTDTKDIQIDHVVPLKNSYVSGAWKWTQQMRCMYANFLGNDFHLLAVKGTENLRKSDRAPDQYMPPQQAYQCEYIKNWLKIKLIWGLAMNPSEAESIKNTIRQNNCDPELYQISIEELRDQRNLILQNQRICDKSAANIATQ